MAIDFPNSPTLNQQFTVGDRTWTWDGTRWESIQIEAKDAYQVALDNGFIGTEQEWLDSLAGVIQSTTAPQNTNAIWIDTDEPGNAVLPLAGTTGQILAKASNSDYDTEWIDAPDPDLSGLIPKSTVTTAGDLIVADGNASVTRLGIGTTGQFLTSNGTTATWSSVPTPDSIITTQGDLIIGDASANAARLGIGTNGQILQSNGTTASWATVTSGGMTELASASVNGTPNSFAITSISADYNYLQLHLKDFSWANNETLMMRINNDSTNGRYFVGGSGGDGFGLTDLNGIRGDNTKMNVWVNIYNYNNSTGYALIQVLTAYRRESTNANTTTTFVGGYEKAATISELNIYTTDSSTWDNGTYKLYGVK